MESYLDQRSNVQKTAQCLNGWRNQASIIEENHHREIAMPELLLAERDGGQFADLVERAGT